MTPQKTKKRQCKSYKGTYFFKKSPKLLYFEGQFFKKKSRQQIPDLLEQIFFTTSADTKKRKKEKAVQILQRNYFFEKRPKVVAIIRGPKQRKELEIKFQLFLGKFSPLPIDTKGGKIKWLRKSFKCFFFLKKAPKLLYFDRPNF